MFTKKILIFFLLLFFSGSSAYPLDQTKDPHAGFWWSLLIPGGGYFYAGERAKGLAYLTATGGLLGWGIAVDSRKSGGEVNSPLVYAQHIHVTQIYMTQRLLVRQSDPRHKITFDTSALGQLALSPFKAENLKNPWVIGFSLLGIGLNYAEARLNKENKDYWDVRNVQILGNNFNREAGLAAYSAYWIPISLGAGVSEETLFRGLIQTDFEENWGKTGGWMGASTLFGLAHFDGTGRSLPNVAFATAAGLFFGWRFQQRGYKLSEVIAEHFWFDTLAGLTLFLTDPENNALGAKVAYHF